MKKVEEVVIAFENCEEIVLPIQAFGRIEMDGIHKVVSRVGLYDVLCLDVAGEIAIEITPKANQLGTIKPEPAPYGNVFERLTSYRDIVSIEFRYDNGETFEVMVRSWGKRDSGACRLKFPHLSGYDSCPPCSRNPPNCL